MRSGDLLECPEQGGESLASPSVCHSHLLMLFLFFRYCWSEQPQIPLVESSCPLRQGGGRMSCCNHCWGHHAAGEGIRML